jgi:hypothetical protein
MAFFVKIAKMAILDQNCHFCNFKAKYHFSFYRRKCHFSIFFVPTVPFFLFLAKIDILSKMLQSNPDITATPRGAVISRFFRLIRHNRSKKASNTYCYLRFRSATSCRTFAVRCLKIQSNLDITAPP